MDVDGGNVRGWSGLGVTGRIADGDDTIPNPVLVLLDLTELILMGETIDVRTSVVTPNGLELTLALDDDGRATLLAILVKFAINWASSTAGVLIAFGSFPPETGLVL